MKISEIVDYTVKDSSNIETYNATGSLDITLEDKCYILDTGSWITIQSPGNIIKYTKLILNNDNTINWSEMQYEDMF
jgi:hypothetical protein